MKDETVSTVDRKIQHLEYNLIWLYLCRRHLRYYVVLVYDPTSLSSYRTSYELRLLRVFQKRNYDLLHNGT